MLLPKEHTATNLEQQRHEYLAPYEVGLVHIERVTIAPHKPLLEAQKETQISKAITNVYTGNASDMLVASVVCCFERLVIQTCVKDRDSACNGKENVAIPQIVSVNACRGPPLHMQELMNGICSQSHTGV